MRRFAKVAAVVAAAAAAAVPAVAADYAAPSIDAPTVIPAEEVGTGWYLRGDIGYDRANARSVSTVFPDMKHGSPSVSRDVFYGGGFGYKYNEWFRADITADYSSRNVRWANGGCLGGVCPNPWKKSQGTLVNIPILANAYLDLGNWSGLTPYVGAGLGFAVTKISGLGFSGPGVAVTTRANSQSSLAAAAMAGFSYDIGGGLQLDAGYRYLWVDQAKIGRGDWTDAMGTARTTRNSSGSVNDLDFHQFRVGMRYFVY